MQMLEYHTLRNIFLEQGLRRSLSFDWLHIVRYIFISVTFEFLKLGVFLQLNTILCHNCKTPSRDHQYYFHQNGCPMYQAGQTIKLNNHRPT